VAGDDAFCYIDFAMRKFACVALIIGALSFSAGEGLRLTPFPVSALPQLEETNGLTAGIAKYGPLDVPSQVQKRTKRQITDFACLPMAAGRQLVTFDRHYSEDESIQLWTSRFVFRPSGRAPPRLS